MNEMRLPETWDITSTVLLKGGQDILAKDYGVQHRYLLKKLNAQLLTERIDNEKEVLDILEKNRHKY